MKSMQKSFKKKGTAYFKRVWKKKNRFMFSGVKFSNSKTPAVESRYGQRGTEDKDFN
jgi:hypothetical protein